MTEFIDDRARQDTLIKQPERAEPESRIDRGASDEFSDDRADMENSQESGDQDLLVTKTDDRNQRDLTGDIAGESPQWSE